MQITKPSVTGIILCYRVELSFFFLLLFKLTYRGNHSTGSVRRERFVYETRGLFIGSIV